MNILAISGSNCSASYNRALLGEARNMLPENMSLEIFDISKFPLFSEDTEGNLPDDVRSQLHLRQIMVDLNMYPINEPEFLLGGLKKHLTVKCG